MTFRGRNSWRPNSRRHRRRRGKPDGPASEGADRTLLIVLAAFTLVALIVAVAVGVFLL